MSEKNSISFFPQSEQNLHPEGMPNLRKCLRDSGRITQDSHAPRKGFRSEWLKKSMNPVPIVLGMPTKPENMQERHWLSTIGASGIRNPNVFEPRL